jgi:hypothetical protein
MSSRHPGLALAKSINFRRFGRCAILLKNGRLATHLEGCVGCTRDSVLKYDLALKTDKFLLVVHGSPDAVTKAKKVIAGTVYSHCAVHGEAVCV